MKVNVKDVDFSVMNLKNIGSKPVEQPILKELKLSIDKTDGNVQLLDTCRQYWDSLYEFRARRMKARKYARGDQWHELIEDPDTGDTITEEDYIKSQGKIPFKENIIRQLVKNLLGQYRTNPTVSTIIARDRDEAKLAEMLSIALRNVYDLNYVRELDARNLEEFLISGAVISKVGYKYWKERNMEDVYIENINPNRIFFNTDISDFRLFDLRLIGEIIDTTIDDIVSVFAEDEAAEERIKSWYTNYDIPETPVDDALSAQQNDNIDFYTPAEVHKCRVIAVWQLKSEWRVYAHDYLDGSYNIVDYTLDDIKKLNEYRLSMAEQNGVDKESIPLIEAWKRKEQFWYFKFLTPYGQCLSEGETPYEHGEHPYSCVFYPMLDGEVWGLVEDLIDTQRSINHLTSLYSSIIGASAKGVLLVPEEAIPDDMDIDDFSDEWTKFNGVIKIKTKAGVTMPKQVSSNSTNIGISELLAYKLKLIQDISGVQNAIQGQAPKSGTPASLYAQEAQNATINSKDMLSVFSFQKQRRDTKILKVLRQFYKEKRYLAMAGSDYNEEAREYDPDKVRNLDFDVKVAESQDTPIFRNMMDDMLFRLLEGNMIDVKMFLENSNFPFAEKLLETIKQREEQMAGGQQNMSPEMMKQINETGQQANEQANPEAMAMLDRMMKNK